MLLLLAIDLAGCRPTDPSERIPLSSLPDLNGHTLEGTNRRGEHCEVRFNAMNSRPGFFFVSPSRVIEGDRWWYYEHRLILDCSAVGWSGTLVNDKVMFEEGP